MLQPPRHVADAIRRVFPGVRLVWWRKGQRWALVSAVNKRALPIHLYGEGEHPTVKNTLGLLREASIAHLKTDWEMDLWLRRKIHDRNERIREEGRKNLDEASLEAAKRMVYVARRPLTILNPLRKWNGAGKRRMRR